jgi:1-acyl-sn-glycerol-3-phosphate acyltransferase
LKVIFLNTKEEYKRVSVSTYTHRKGMRDVPAVMMVAKELEIPTIRTVMKAGHALMPYTPLFHALGGVGVGRGTGDARLLTGTLKHLSEEGYPSAFFNEGFRVRPYDRHGNVILGSDGEPISTRKVQGVKPGAVRVSLEADIPYLPIALAGTAIDDVIEAKRVPIVACVAPFLYPADFMHFDDPVREMQTAALESQQAALNLAYLDRDSYFISVA